MVNPNPGGLPQAGSRGRAHGRGVKGAKHPLKLNVSEEYTDNF